MGLSYRYGMFDCTSPNFVRVAPCVDVNSSKVNCKKLALYIFPQAVQLTLFGLEVPYL